MSGAGVMFANAGVAVAILDNVSRKGPDSPPVKGCPPWPAAANREKKSNKAGALRWKLLPPDGKTFLYSFSKVSW